MLSQSQEGALTFLKDVFKYKESYVKTEKIKIDNEIKDIFYKDIKNIILDYVSPEFSENNGELRMNLLQGAGGVGKTRTIATFINEIPAEYKVIVSSPTHKAKSVIMKQIESLDIVFHRIKFNTVAALLSLKKIYDKNGNAEFHSFTNEGESEVKSEKKNIIIIDEASMLCESDYYDLKEYVDQRPNNIVIFVADHCQLPPVDEDKSIIYDKGFRTYTIEGNMRVKNKEVAKLTSELRGYVIGEKFDIYETKHVFRIDLIKKRLYNTFIPGKDKVLTYSRKKAVFYNNIIRNHFFNKPKDKYVSGEKLVFIDFGTIDGDVYYTGDEVCVKQCNVINKLHYDWGKGYKVYSLLLDNGYNMDIIHEDEKKVYDLECWKKKKELQRKISAFRLSRTEINLLWEKYNRSALLFNPPVDYSYAQTVYQSQGSTYNKVYIDVNNIHGCNQYNKDLFARSVYTAASRASEEIILYCINNNFT